MLKDLAQVCDTENVAMEPAEYLESHERRQDLSKGRGCVVLMYEFCDRAYLSQAVTLCSEFIFSVFTMDKGL